MFHLALPSLSSYAATHALQTHLVRYLLSLKSVSRPLPPPLILTMELLPTYTFGRRQIIPADSVTVLSKVASVIKAQRGGLTTYHGPGQVVGYPLIDLKQIKLTPRCYVHVLESSIIRLCSDLGIDAFRTGDTGVWCHTPSGDRKIASIGVHLRRNITSHGVGINFSDEVVEYFDRIDACGLGKGVTTFKGMGVTTTRADVEGRWVRIFGEEIGEGIRTLKDVGELEEEWGLKKGEILDVLLQADMHHDLN